MQEESTNICEQDIASLLDEGIGKSDVDKLRAEGIFSIASLIMITKKDLIKVKGLSEQKIEKIIAAALKLRVIV